VPSDERARDADRTRAEILDVATLVRLAPWPAA